LVVLSIRQLNDAFHHAVPYARKKDPFGQAGQGIKLDTLVKFVYIVVKFQAKKTTIVSDYAEKNYQTTGTELFSFRPKGIRQKHMA